MTIPFRKLKDEWMKDPAFRAEYERLKPEFALALALIKARTKAGMTQADVAKKMRTTQSVIARIESGRNPPNRKTLGRYANAARAPPNACRKAPSSSKPACSAARCASLICRNSDGPGSAPRSIE